MGDLLSKLPSIVPSIPASDIVNAGAGSLTQLAKGDESILQNLRQAYASAIHNTLILALTAQCVSILFAMGMEWRNVKVEGKARKATAVEDQDKKSQNDRMTDKELQKAEGENYELRTTSSVGPRNV